LPTFRELERFILNDDRYGAKWEKIRTADHDYYEKKLPNGEIWRTKVSFAKQKEIPSRLFQEILKHQLYTEKREFNKISKGR